MRWGVRDEMTDEHMTTVKILDQLKNVQKLRHIWSWFVQGSLYEWTARLSEVLHGPKFHLFWGSKVGTHCIVFKGRFWCLLFTQGTATDRYHQRSILQSWPSSGDIRHNGQNLYKYFFREALVSMGNDVHLLDKWYIMTNDIPLLFHHIPSCFTLLDVSMTSPKVPQRQQQDSGRIDPPPNHHSSCPFPKQGKNLETLPQQIW